MTKKEFAQRIRPFLGIRPFRRHSLVLLVAGSIYVFMGFSYVHAPLSKERAAALAVALQWVDIRLWGSLFIFVGVLAIVSSRWPPFSETWGYTLLTGLSSLWGGFYLAAFVLGLTPSSILTTVLLWGLVAFMWWAISGLINPDRPVTAVIKHERP